MADNTRKTSNIIHDLDKVKDDVSNNSQNIQNNTESIGNIKVYDSHIWLSTSKGLTVTQDGNTTTNNEQPTEWKLEADTNYLNNTLNFATQDDIPSVYVKDIKSGDITTLQVTNDGKGTYTLTATGGGGSGGGGFENITLAEGTCIDIATEPYDDNGTAKTKITVAADTDCLNTTLNFAKPTDIGDGNITLAQGTGISVTGSNATANQKGNSGWTVAVNNDVALKSDIPTAVEPGNGAINLTGGTGIDVTGDNGTANQTSDSSQTISIDSTVALKSEIPSVPGNIVTTLNTLKGDLTLESTDKNIGIAANGTDNINLTLNASLNDLTNVSTGIPSDNQVLTWDGSNWTSQNASGGTFKTINGTNPDASGNFNIINGTGINATAGTNNLTLECTVQNTDTGILTLTDGTSTVPESGRSVEFTSSDASVQYTLTGNKIDLTVPAAGLNIKGSVQYAEPQTEADGIYTDGNGEAHEVLWLPSQYLEAASGVDSPALGDLWIIQYEGSAADGPPPGTSPYGHGYVFSLKGDNSGDYEWVDAGRLQGPPGEDGTDISLEENVTVNANSTISSSTGEFVENASTPGEYALTLNIAPSDVNADGVKSLNGLNEAINITSSDSFLKISNNDSVNPKTIDLTLNSVNDGGQNLALKTDIKDGQINMTASNGVKMSTGSANATANQATNTEFKIEANYTEIAGNISVGNLSNVCDTSPTDKQVLSWDATANSNEGQWCPANATAAAALPISDNRDPTTVKLDSPSANTFAISTGGVERVKVGSQGNVGIGVDPVATVGVYYQHTISGSSIASFLADNVIDSSTQAASYFRSRASIEAGVTVDNLRHFSADAKNIKGTAAQQVAYFCDDLGDGAYSFYSEKNPAYIKDIQTSSVSGLNANEASIELGANLTVSTGGSQSVIVTADKRVGFGATPASSVQFQLTGSNATGMRTDLLHNSATRYQNSDGQLMVSTADGTSDIAVMSGFRIVGRSNAGATVDQYWGIHISEVPTLAVAAGGVRTAINGDGADEGKASANGFFNVYADGTAPNYFGGEVRITPTAQLNVNKIVGATAPNSDASIELGADLTVSTGGVERVKVKPASYGSAAVTVGEDHAHSIGGVSVRNDPTQVNYASQMQMRFVDENGKYAYIGCTEPRFAIGGANALLDGGTFFAGHDNGNAVLFSGAGDVIIATGGLAANSERLRITDDSIQSKVDIQTPSVSGLNANEASIELGAELTVSTGGQERVAVDGSGKVEIGTGSTSTSSVFTVNGVSNSRFRRNARSEDINDFQEGDCQELRIVNNANGGNDSGVSMSHWSWAVGNTIDQRTQRNQIRFWDEAISFQTADGTTNVDVTNDGNLIVRNQVQTPSVSGLVDNDASIELGANLTLDNKSGIIWLGSSTNAPAGTTSLLVGSSDGDGKNLLIASGQPKTAAEAGSAISFATVEGNGDRAKRTRMYISPEGNVGIDAVNPDERLVVGGSIKANRLKGYGVNPQIILESQQAFLNASDGSDYTPTQPNSIATKQYVDDNRFPLPDPDVPFPPVGSGAGYTWDQLERTPGLYLSGVYGIGGIYSIIGFSDMQAGTTPGDANGSGINMDLTCYWSTDGRTWTEGFVGGNWVSSVDIYGDLHAPATPNNAYGKYCDGTQVIFTGNAFTSTGKTWQGFQCTRGPGSYREDRYVGDGVPIYWDSGIVADQAIDPNTGTYPGTLWPEGPVWITSKLYAIADLEDDTVPGMVPVGGIYAVTTNTDVQLTNSRDVTCPKVFFSLNGDDNYYFSEQKLYKPIQSEAAIRQANKTDPLSTYFKELTWVWTEYADACCSPDGKTVLALDSSDNQFYWWVHKRTTLTVPSDLWQVTGLCCAYDRSKGFFAAATSDTVRVYEAPYTSGTYAYGGRLIATYTIPQSAEWTHLSITGGVYLLMSNSGSIARLDTNNPANTTFEMIGANSPAVFSANPVLAGTNGRFLIAGGEDVNGFPDFGKGYGFQQSDLPTGPAEDQRYAWSGGDNDPGLRKTTADVELTDLVETGSGGQRSTRKLLTQKDANEYFAEEIEKRAVVVTLTQAEYDALSPPDENTLYLIT